MSWSWYVYSTRPPNEVLALDTELADAISDFFDDQDHDVDDECAEAGAGGPPPPTPDEVAAYRAKFREIVPADVLERLGRCRATFAFDYVHAQPEESPLQVSILRFCLDRLAPCVMDWGDLSIELGETALARLAPMRSRGRLGPSPPPKPRAIKRRAAKPGELRAVQILQRVEAAAANPESALDLRTSLAKLSAGANTYLMLLVEEGAIPDATARKKLGLSADALLAMIDELEKAIAS